jgi:hypothetical protein
MDYSGPVRVLRVNISLIGFPTGPYIVHRLSSGIRCESQNDKMASDDACTGVGSSHDLCTPFFFGNRALSQYCTVDLDGNSLRCPLSHWIVTEHAIGAASIARVFWFCRPPPAIRVCTCV